MFILIEQLVDCKTKEELLKRERHYIDMLINVNHNKPLQTAAEYYRSNIVELTKKSGPIANVHVEVCIVLIILLIM
jgi:hypothetical protein